MCTLQTDLLKVLDCLGLLVRFHMPETLVYARKKISSRDINTV